jgi:molybdenum cofactor cytidylyltransferase
MDQSTPATRAERQTAAVVLAAGASTRLGQAKQLVQVEGESLLRRTARLAVEAGCAPVVVVLGFHAERMRVELQGLEVVPIVHPEWATGMGSSLRRGVEFLTGMNPVPDGVLLLVCDQPRLTLDHLRALLVQHDKGRQTVTASAYEGTMGVPALFARELLGDLARLEGDRGARELIRSHAAQGISWPEGGVDLDVQEDLRWIE